MEDKKKFDWKKTIKVNIVMLQMAGLWPPRDQIYGHNCYSIWAFITISLFLIGHVFFQTVNLYFIRNNLHEITGTIFILVTDIGAIMKTYYMIKNMRILKELMTTLNGDMFQPKNADQMLLVQPSLNFWKTMFKVFWATAVGALFFWAIFPIMDDRKYRLPFLAWYPFKTDVSPNYELIYTYQIISICFVAVVNSDIDTLIAALNVYIATQFEILCDDLKNLHEADDVNQKLIDCVNHHREILRFAKKTNDCFNWIILLHFFTSALSISLTLFQLTVVTPFSSEFFCLLSFENAMTVEIFIYCWFGNEVELESSKIPYAVFQSNWIDFSQDVKKKLIFFVLRCQTPCKISCLNLFYLSLETLVKILRTAVSYFTLLHQVNNRALK